SHTIELRPNRVRRGSYLTEREGRGKDFDEDAFHGDVSACPGCSKCRLLPQVVARGASPGSLEVGDDAFPAIMSLSRRRSPPAGWPGAAWPAPFSDRRRMESRTAPAFARPYVICGFSHRSLTSFSSPRLREWLPAVRRNPAERRAPCWRSIRYP